MRTVQFITGDRGGENNLIKVMRLSENYIYYITLNKKSI